MTPVEFLYKYYDKFSKMMGGTYDVKSSIQIYYDEDYGCSVAIQAWEPNYIGDPIRHVRFVDQIPREDIGDLTSKDIVSTIVRVNDVYANCGIHPKHILESMLPPKEPITWWDISYALMYWLFFYTLSEEYPTFEPYKIQTINVAPGLDYILYKNSQETWEYFMDDNGEVYEIISKQSHGTTMALYTIQSSERVVTFYADFIVYNDDKNFH